MFSKIMMRGLLAACLALPIALAVSGDASAQKAKDLKCKGCVGSKDIGKNAVREKHIKNNAVTSSKIKNGTIKAEDIAAGVLGSGGQVLTGGFNQGAAFANGFTGPG